MLTSLAAVMAETRMAAAGSFCGTGQPAILLDAAGLPLLDPDGVAIAAPDCPACHLSFALPPCAPSSLAVHTPFLGLAGSALPESLSPIVVRLGGFARAPPYLA
ncbi:MAG TPA: hypothetical protein EYP31_09060 [Roseibacterium sp.]|nr:hypothetical protein [Roseibacterium sp.]